MKAFEKTLKPLTRINPAFALRNGVFCPLERQVLRNEKLRLYSENTSELKRIKNYLAEVNPQVEYSVHSYEDNDFVTPFQLLNSIGNNILDDLDLLKRKNFLIRFGSLEGCVDNLWLHNDAKVSNYAVLDVRDGPIVIDSEAQISAFSLLKGPLYIGKNTILDKVFIYNTIIGENCRIGGEIGDSIIGNFSNKHHEGFLGHSLVGDWVNLGALTTTSDLKNNYGEVRLKYRTDQFDTGTIKLGSIIGDYVKTAIGTMLNTGTIIDFGCLLFAGHPAQKYFSPFFWGGDVGNYELSRFIADTRLIMARRSKTLSNYVEKEINLLYSAEFLST